MIKKIDILGVQLDNYTVREEVRQVEHYLTSGVLNTIESVSMKMLMEAETDSTLREVLDSLDLAVIGEKEILQAAGVDTMQRIRETEENDFYFEFFKRIERNRKSVFLLGQTEEQIEQINRHLQEEFPKLTVAGEYAVEKCVGNLETVINEINAAIPDVIVSVLPTPMQEHFLWEHRGKLNASIWYGIGETGIGKGHIRLSQKILRVLRRGRLKNSIHKYEEKKYSGRFTDKEENGAE